MPGTRSTAIVTKANRDTTIFSLTSAFVGPNPTPHRQPHHGHRADSDCHARKPLGYVTPSHGAVPIPITAQGQLVTTYIPTAVARGGRSAISVTKYLTSTYIWYSTYVPGYPHGKPQFISRGDQALTLPPKEPPRYAVRNMIVTTTGTIRVGKKIYHVKKVPTKIQYTKEVSRSFGTCKAQAYFQWSQQNDERASRLGSKRPIGGNNINLEYGGLGGHDAAFGSHEKHVTPPKRLLVDYVRCRDEVCTTEAQNWSVGYRAQVKKHVIVAKFSGWCDGKKPCKLCADVQGRGRVTITTKVHTPGPCTISTRITTEETVTKTITRTRTINTTVHTTATQTKTASSSGQSNSRASSSAETSFSSMPANAQPNSPSLLASSEPHSSSPESMSTSESQPLLSNSPPSSSQETSTDTSSTSKPTTSSEPTQAPPTGGTSSPFRIRIRDPAPTKRLRRQQSAPWYVGVVDSTMAVVTLPSDIVIFSISNQQLKLPNSDFAFADSDDLVARGPILIASTSSGPSTVFSIEPGTNRLLWTNGEFKKGTATYCVDDDYEINGVYAGEVDAFCDTVELIAEFTNDMTTSSSSITTSPTSMSSLTNSMTSTSGSSSTTESVLDGPLSQSSTSPVLSSTEPLPAASTSSSPQSSSDPASSTSAPNSVSGSSIDMTTSSQGMSSSTSTSETPPSASITEVPTTSSLPTSSMERSSEPETSSAAPDSSSSAPQCTPISSSINQIQNPGFESGAFSPWSPSTEGTNPEFSISITHPNKGSRSALIELTSPDSSVTLTQTIPTCQGRTYTGAVWLDLAITGDSTSCSLYILINGAAVAEQGSTAGSYSEVPFQFTATATTASVGLLASCTTGVTKATFNIDDVELVDKSPSTR
ncbi:hypothetical protein TWF281_005464 [Arthrobotrys megalospora]